MQHVLRAISGPHAGAVYVLGSRTTIGRASDCEIQIVHEGVSRHHAKVTLEDDGTVVVSDLSSDNGTFVEDQRVERHVLVEGEVLRVMRSRFAYEVSPADEAQTSAVFRRKVTSGDSLRQTVHHDKPLTAVRIGLGSGATGGLPGGTLGERGRAYSRPQAAAPALSGARPGAAGAGRAPEAEAQASATAMPTSGPPSLHAAGSLGSGWIRLTRPLDAPGSMRPGATLSGVPRVGDDESPEVATPPPRPAEPDASATSPERSTKGITAEYGAVGSREPTERDPAAMSREPPSTDRSAGEADGELDAMKTLPALRRKDKRGATPRSSATPTEQVPIVREPPPDPAHDDDAHVTRPKVTLVPPERGPAPRAGPRSIAYEDTLRFQRPEPGAPVRTERPDVPQPRPHATSAEVISALEALLPDGEVEPSSERRPDARTHVPSPDAATIEALLDAVVGEAEWPTDIAGLSAVDQVQRRAQQVLEHADREHRRREGLERLVDILEYRELRLRALRSHGDAAVAERCTALEQTLQQHPPAGDDMAAMRRYHRFVCSIPAQLTHRRRGETMTAMVEIEDLSAGGARITFGECSIDAGETVWLTIDLAVADRSRVPSPEASAVVMKARVVWSHPHTAKLGLVFAGAPEYG